MIKNDLRNQGDVENDSRIAPSTASFLFDSSITSVPPIVEAATNLWGALIQVDNNDTGVVADS
jgi:hypothetical protein